MNASAYVFDKLRHKYVYTIYLFPYIRMCINKSAWYIRHLYSYIHIRIWNICVFDGCITIRILYQMMTLYTRALAPPTITSSRTHQPVWHFICTCMHAKRLLLSSYTHMMLLRYRSQSHIDKQQIYIETRPHIFSSKSITDVAMCAAATSTLFCAARV